MKKSVILPFIFMIMFGCGGSAEKATTIQKPAPAAPKPTATAEFITEGVPPEVIQKGNEAANKLQSTLKTQLVAAIRGKGLKGALDFCSENAQKLTNEVNLSYQGTVSIKRTTLRFRNEQDKPDKFEESALQLIQKSMADGGTPPDQLVQKISENGDTKYRYYKPLLIGTACLACHGDEKKMKPEILKEIRKLYPNGTATGYSKGQLRGVVRVEMQATKASFDI